MCHCDKCYRKQWKAANKGWIDKRTQARKCQDECENLHCKNKKVPGKVACKIHTCLNTECEQKAYRTGRFAFCGRCKRPTCSFPGCNLVCVNLRRADYFHCANHQGKKVEEENEGVKEGSNRGSVSEKVEEKSNKGSDCETPVKEITSAPVLAHEDDGSDSWW